MEDLAKPQIMVESTFDGNRAHQYALHYCNRRCDGGRPDLLTLEQIGTYSAQFERGKISENLLSFYKHHASPSCGAYSFMGTAATMQVMAEALGLMFHAVLNARPFYCGGDAIHAILAHKIKQKF